MRDVRRSWSTDHLWAKVYGRVTADPRVGSAVWRVAVGSSAEELHGRARRALADLPPGGRVLDLPCGSGVTLRDVPRGHDLDYVAADISPAMLERTRAEARRLGVDGVRTVERDVQALADPDASYDLVLAFTSLHCFPDPRGAVDELVRVLRPGGRLVGSVFTTDAGARFVPVHAAGRAIGVLGPGCTTADVRRWLPAAGLASVEVVKAGGMTYFEGVRA